MADGGWDVAVGLHDTIVHARDRAASARFPTALLGLPPPARSSPVHAVEVADGVTPDDPDGHRLELSTVPSGGRPEGGVRR